MPVRGTPKKGKTLARTPSCTDEVNAFQKEVSNELDKTYKKLREAGDTLQAQAMRFQEELHAPGQAKNHAVEVLQHFGLEQDELAKMLWTEGGAIHESIQTTSIYQ